MLQLCVAEAGCACATMVDAHTSRMCISHRRMPRGAARRRSQCIGVTGDATRGLCALSDKRVHVNTVLSQCESVPDLVKR